MRSTPSRRLGNRLSNARDRAGADTCSRACGQGAVMDKAQPETHVSVGVFLRAILGGGGAYVAWRLALVVLMILAASALLPLGPVALQEIVDHFARHAAAGPTLFAAVFLYVFSQAVSRLFDALRVLIYA